MNNESIDDILEDPEIEDMAFDFIEQRVGCLDFKNNWANIANPLKVAERWLVGQGYQADKAGAVVKAVDRLAVKGAKWL